MIEYHYKKRTWRALFAAADAVGGFLFYVFRGSRKKDLPSAPKILVVNLNHIGDMILATPLLRALKTNIKDANVSVLCAPWSVGVIANNKNVDEILARRLSMYAGRGASVKNVSLPVLAAEIRKKKYDCLIDVKGDPRVALLGYWAGIPVRVGRVNYGFGFLYTHRAKFYPGKHQVELNLDLGRLITPINESYEAEMCLRDEDFQVATAYLAKYGLKPESKFVTMQVTAGTAAKEWPLKRFAELANKLWRERGVRTVLIGADDVMSKLPEFSRYYKGPLIFNPGFSINESAALIKYSRGFVGNDSVAGHMAAAVGTPLISIFSAANSRERWQPNTDRGIVLASDVDCGACEKANCETMDCLRKITVEQVFSSLDKLINVHA